MAARTPRFSFSRPSPTAAVTQVFGSEAVDTGDVAAALRDLGIVVDSRCSSSMQVWLCVCAFGCSTDS